MAASSVQTSSDRASLDFLVQSVKQEDDELSLRRMHRFILEATTDRLRAQYEIESSLNYRFVENDFYSLEELEEFAERGQPPTKRNEIAPILERIAGQFIQTRQAVTFLGRNTPADDPTAALSQDYQRWNDQLNNIEFEEQDMSWDGLVGGVGWLKSTVKTNELGQKYACYRSLNPFHVYRDPRSTRYNPNEDAKYIVEGSWMDLEDAIALFPDREDDLLDYVGQGGVGYGLSSSSGYIDPSLRNDVSFMGALYGLSVQGEGTRRRVRPFEIWYKRKIKIYHLFTRDGVLALPIPLDAKRAKALVKELDQGYTIESTYQDRMYTGVVLGNLLIHHDVSEHATNLFPYVPFYSGLRKNGSPLPLTNRLVPINEIVNKLESKAMTLVANRQTVAEKNAVDDIEKFQTEKARPDGFMEVREGALSGGKVVTTNNLEIGQGHLMLLQEAKDSIRRVSGHDDELMNMPEMRSGAGVSRKQMIAGLTITPMHNNLRRTRLMRAQLSYELMKQYLTEEIAFQITDDPNAPRTVQMTKGAIQAIKERTYDIVITETKDYAVLREQQAEMLLTVLPQLAQLGPGMVKLGIQLTDFRDKEGLLRLIDEQTAQGPAIPKISLNQDWKDLTPELQAYYAMTAFKSQELAQAIMQRGEDPAFLKKLKADLIATQIREGTRATVERGKVDLSALQTAIDGRMQLRQEFNDQTGMMPPQNPMMNPGATQP